MFKRALLWLPMLATIGLVQADEAAVTAKLEQLMPDVQVDSLQPLDNTGLYEVVINGDILYVSADGRYAVQGDVISLEKRENVTEQRRVDLRKDILDALDEQDMIVFGDDSSKYTLTVFTDIDCGYCRKLHQQMDEYNDLGIRIRYMAFPRGGIDSESYDKAVNVWCADDRHEAMTLAKQGVDVQASQCSNPVKQDFEIGRKLGVSGTPAMFLESGQVLPGYVPPEKLKEVLDEHSAQS